ncbi:MAG: UDP-glucose 4-epimerase GalE [Spirochaetes bacterium]|nr:MAG: UDP-glucose 4-epimerase GalE [Spirochaetota bacterium]
MKVLVIGGAGYIGSHVSRMFLDRGYSVTVYDNLYSGCRENIFPEAKFVKADILDYSTLEITMKGGFDALIHLAALKAAGESMSIPEKYALNNISGTINILNAASITGVKIIVFSSSAAVYGEPEYIPLDEDHPTNPENFYGFTKLEIERLLEWYDRLKGIKYAALRYFNAAGYDPEGRIRGLEKNPQNLIPVIMEVATGKREKLQIFGDDYPTEDGTGVRDYIHVTDLADAHIKALEYIHSHKESLILNLGSETGLSVLEVLETARKVSGKPIPAEVTKRRPGDPARLVASAVKAKGVLGWNPRYSDPGSLLSTTWKIYGSSG